MSIEQFMNEVYGNVMRRTLNEAFESIYSPRYESIDYVCKYITTTQKS